MTKFYLFAIYLKKYDHLYFIKYVVTNKYVVININLQYYKNKIAILILQYNISNMCRKCE